MDSAVQPSLVTIEGIFDLSIVFRPKRLESDPVMMSNELKVEGVKRHIWSVIIFCFVESLQLNLIILKTELTTVNHVIYFF